MGGQDASILGFTCGSGVSSAKDVAKLYYQVVGPSSTLLSHKSQDVMRQWSTINQGWSKDKLDYGFGLMIINVKPGTSYPPPRDDPNSYIGHGGDTYGFQSDNGYFPSYNA